MRRLAIVLASLALLAGCGGETVSPTPETVVGTLEQPTTTGEGPQLPEGNAAAGKSVYVTAGCGACHIMEAANSTGTVGPNLDEASPELEDIQEQVVNGGGGMPPYKGTLSDKQIADVSQYVLDSTQ